MLRVMVWCEQECLTLSETDCNCMQKPDFKVKRRTVPYDGECTSVFPALPEATAIKSFPAVGQRRLGTRLSVFDDAHALHMS